MIIVILRDETVSTISYGTGSSSNAINLLPLSQSAGAGDGSLTATTQTTYDDVGNVASVEGPLGSTQTTVFHYDADRQRTGIVGPDPDGGGSLLNRALRYTYNALGEATKVERGTVPSQSDSDWANHFSTIEEIDLSFDVQGRPIRQDFASGGTTYNVTQTFYNSVGLVSCQALRMNPAVFASLPSTCVLGTQGSNGPDRLTSQRRSVVPVPSYQTIGSSMPGPVTFGASLHPIVPGISLSAGTQFIFNHTHPSGSQFSQSDYMNSLSYSSIPGFMGSYLSTPSGVYGPPWSYAGTVTGTVGDSSTVVTQPVYNGTPVTPC